MPNIYASQRDNENRPVTNMQLFINRSTDLDLAAARVRESVGQVHACVAHGTPDYGTRPHHVLPRLCVIKMFRAPSNSSVPSCQKISIC
jgi:hypothetical protein